MSLQSSEQGGEEEEGRWAGDRGPDHAGSGKRVLCLKGGGRHDRSEKVPLSSHFSCGSGSISPPSHRLRSCKGSRVPDGSRALTPFLREHFLILSPDWD